MATDILQPGNAADFMAGVALFDELLREAERRSRTSMPESEAMNLGGRNRGGQRLALYALPLIERLLQRPGLARGFAGALGDYVGLLQQGLAPSEGDQYTHLTYEDCVACKGVVGASHG